MMDGYDFWDPAETTNDHQPRLPNGWAIAAILVSAYAIAKLVGFW